MSRQLSEVIIYTDGACAPNPGNGGWAAVLISKKSNARKEISGAEENTTNNRMELLAAVKALKALKYGCHVELHTDSKYLQNAFVRNWIGTWQKNGWKTKNKKEVANQDLWKELLQYAHLHQIQWKWVKGHSLDVENNRCDELAVLARKNLVKTQA